MDGAIELCPNNSGPHETVNAVKRSARWTAARSAALLTTAACGCRRAACCSQLSRPTMTRGERGLSVRVVHPTCAHALHALHHRQLDADHPRYLLCIRGECLSRDLTGRCCARMCVEQGNFWLADEGGRCLGTRQLPGDRLAARHWRARARSLANPSRDVGPPRTPTRAPQAAAAALPARAGGTCFDTFPSSFSQKAESI